MKQFTIRIVQYAGCCLLVGTIAYCVPSSATAQSSENSGEEATNVQKKEQPETQQQQNDKQERKKAVTYGFAMLFLLVFSAVVVAIGIMFWGARMRRVARAKTKQRADEDPLWYLKPEKKKIEPRATEKRRSSVENDENESTSDQ